MQLLHPAPLGLVRADVLHRRRHEPAEQRDELDLLVRERVGRLPGDGQHPDRPRADRQRRDELAAQAERDEQTVLRELRVGEVVAHDRMAGEHALQHGALERADAAGREQLVRAAAGGGDRRRRVVLDEHDRRAVERNEAAQLDDERAERLLDLQRRAERAGAAVRRLERVDVAAELVAKRLGLARAHQPESRLLLQTAHEPADDEPAEDEDAGGERRAVAPEARRPEVVRPPPLVEEQERDQQQRRDDPADQPVPERALDHDEDQRPAHLASVLVGEDRRVRGDDGGVEDERGEAEPRPRSSDPRRASTNSITVPTASTPVTAHAAAA